MPRPRQPPPRALADACRAVEVWPVKTNAAFLARCLDHPDFIAGEVDTGFIETRLDALIGPTHASAKVLEAAAIARLAVHEIPAALIGFRLNADPSRSPPATRQRNPRGAPHPAAARHNAAGRDLCR